MEPTRYALIKLRVATANDFTNENGLTKFGAVYFQQKSTGEIERKICYLTEATNKDNFKQLFNSNQIYVFCNQEEVESTCVEEEELEVYHESLNETII